MFRKMKTSHIQFFSGKELSSLVLINPDNPTGNYIEKKDLLRLVAWAKEQDIQLVLDESFVDFAEEEDSTLIEQKVLDENPHLFVMKSISKSYGVPGLRLGVLASGNTELIAKMKKDVAIWNINSFGEFFMQIYEKYQKDYATSLKKIKHARAVFEEALSHISGIKVIPSQANYVMCELNSITSRDLAVALLERNVFIKDLSSKIGNGKQYIRLAVRSEEENEYLIKQLKELL